MGSRPPTSSRVRAPLGSSPEARPWSRGAVPSAGLCHPLVAAPAGLQPAARPTWRAAGWGPSSPRGVWTPPSCRMWWEDRTVTPGQRTRQPLWSSQRPYGRWGQGTTKKGACAVARPGQHRVLGSGVQGCVCLLLSGPLGTAQQVGRRQKAGSWLAAGSSPADLKQHGGWGILEFFPGVSAPRHRRRTF